MKSIVMFLILFLSCQISAQVKKPVRSENTLTEPAIVSQSNLSNSYQEKSDQLLQDTRLLTTQKNVTNATKQKREQLTQNLKSNQPNSALYYFNAFLSTGRANSSYDLLQKAHQKAPLDVTFIKEIAGYNARNGNFEQLRSNLKMLMNLDVLSAGLNDYFVDLLKASPKNSTLIFHGFDDSYNALYVQQVLGVRKDLKIINLFWLTITDYRKTLKKEGFSIPSSQLVDASFLRNFIDINQRKAIGVSVTLPIGYLSKLPPDANLCVTAYWVNSNKSLKVSDLKFIAQKPSGNKAITWSKNYLIYLNQQRVKYKSQNNFSEAKYCAEKMKNIGQWNDISATINKILAQ